MKKSEEKLWKRSKILFILKNCFIPSKQGGALAMYHKIMVIGVWILLICGTLSVVLFFYKECVFIFPLLIEFLVGIFCSMIVVIVTSILQFQKMREEMFEDFYSRVFFITSIYKEMMGENGVIDKEDAEGYEKVLKEEKDSYDNVAFKLFWFTKEKSDAHLEVVRFIQLMFSTLATIKKSKGDGPTAEGNFLLVEKVVKNMKILSKKYYPDSVNLFMKNSWE